MNKQKQPELSSRRELSDIMDNSVSIVRIPRTRKSVRVRWIKPYTLERLTRVWQERENAQERIETGAQVLKDMAIEPYFAFKEASLIILNHDLRIRLFHWLHWRILAYRYDETQVTPILEEGKKKLPLMAHFETMVLTTDMRTDWKMMTKAEAEQYRAELLLAAKQPLSRIFPRMVAPVGDSSGGSATSATDVS